MTDALEAFLAGDRPDDVALYLADAYVDDPETLADRGVRVDGGVVLVVDGERGRRVFSSITGADAMGFAREAGGVEGDVIHAYARCACGAGHSHRWVAGDR